MSSALDQFERSLVTASRALHPLEQTAPAQTDAADDTRRPAARRQPRGGALRPRRLMITLVALVVLASGVAAASSLLWPSQRLADGKVNCFLSTYGTGVASKTLAVGDVRPHGQLPISMCRRWYRLNRYRLNDHPTGLLVADLATVSLRARSRSKPKPGACKARASSGGT